MEAGQLTNPSYHPKIKSSIGCLREDCKPVLIGSISLGLIQLIVIGLDIANNVDWLTGDTRWPIYLPFLQFIFVSLLMQYILARVSKLWRWMEKNSRSSIASQLIGMKLLRSTQTH